ncbi:MAG: response regulator, partial [Myxococcaceae bacterium]|nr:response regulator [Myxococcaceae bacterium]
MASPVLLVCDDLATVATVKRVLGREGYEVVLATNSADAVIAFGHHLPGLVLLDPAVEGDRGQIVLEELQSHPDGKLLKLMLLGESIPGFGYPMAPLPIEADAFLPLVEQTMRGPGEEPWQVFTSPRATVVADPEAVPAGRPLEPPDQWRTTQRLGESFVRRPGEARPEAPVAAAPALPPEPKPSPADLESALFGDLEAQLQREVEAEATKTVETSLAAMRDDDELKKLEEEVRAEAARRRQARRDSQAELPAATGPEETLRGGGPLRTRDDEAKAAPAPLPGDTISEPGEVPAEDEALRAVGRALAAEKSGPSPSAAAEQSFAALDAAPTPMP